jgi:hypothetical protein
MLPFNKRSRETQASSQALPRFPLTSHSVLAYRPQLESFSDDERTRVMTRSSQPPPLPPQARRASATTRPPPPPTPKQKAAAAAKAIRCYPPKPSMDEPTKSAFHPPPSSRSVVLDIPPPPPMPADMAVTNALGPMTSYSSAPPPPVSTSDLPPAVITSSTQISLGRPTPSWAAALVALGVFAGLVTAVLARGDGDALVHAGAQLVDPTHQAGAAQAVVAAPIIQPTAVIAQPAVTTPMTAVAVKTAACAEDTKDTKVETIKAVDPKPEPIVVKAAPPPVVVAKAPPVVVAPKVAAPKVTPKVEAAVVAAPKVAPKVAAPKVDDAAAADALAKAQLEAALGR